MNGDRARGERAAAADPGRHPRDFLWRRTVGALIVMVVAGLGTGCATTVSGVESADSAQVSQYRSEQAARTSAARREQVVVLCRQSMSSMVVMVRGYNDFVVRLSQTQSYAGAGGLDLKARASLIAGADQIRGKVKTEIAADVLEPVNAFLDSSGRLGDAIGRKLLVGLNPLASRWTSDKQAVLSACGDYLPAPPGIASSAVTPSPPR